MLRQLRGSSNRSVFSGILFCIGVVFVKPCVASDLAVEISNFKHGNGQAVVALFNDPDAFPTKPEKALKTIRAKIANLVATVNFSEVAPGVYAISVYHDENGDNKMDRNFMGIPKEPVAVSMNAVVRFGPPKFADAKFRLEKTNQTIQIRFND